MNIIKKMSWTWKNRCYTGNCNGVNFYSGNCDKITNCSTCRPPLDKCIGCKQFEKLTHLYEPPTSVNTNVNSADLMMFDLSGGMSLYNAHFRPTVVPPFGQNHLPIRNNSRNNFTQYFQTKSF